MPKITVEEKYLLNIVDLNDTFDFPNYFVLDIYSPCFFLGEFTELIMEIINLKTCDLRLQKR